MPADNISKKIKGTEPVLYRQFHNRLVELHEAFVYTKKHPRKAKPVILLFFKRLLVRKKRIFLFASPTHGNRGDQMIAFSMKKWCEKYFPDCVYTEYDDSILTDWTLLSLIKPVVKRRDIILIRGGGSVGDRYIDYEYFVRFVLKRYTKNKIIMFPQSINFSSTPGGEAEKSETAEAYDSHPDFTLYTRDEISFALAQNMFTHAKIRLCPDIAMFLFNSCRPAPKPRDGVLCCLRTDVNEIFYNDNIRKQMTEEIEKNHPVKLCDTEAGHEIPLNRREEEIEKLLNLFSESSVAVTDRFHGVIGAVLTRTPCVALRSADHKIISGIKWFKDLEYVFFAENIEDVPNLVEKAMQCKNIELPDFSSYFNGIYEDIING